MKKALVLTLVLLGVGAIAFAGPISGSADVCARFDKIDLIVFDTVVDFDYTIATFVFGATAIFNLNTFDNLFFTAAGTLGAFEFRTMIDFEPQTPAFMAWTTAGRISIGGASLFAVTALRNLATPQSPSYGIGATLGIQGTVGDVNVTAIAAFNASLFGKYYHLYGYDWAVARDAYESCGTWVKPSGLPYSVVQTNCTLAWSGAAIYVDIPLFCLDLTARAVFTCNGFSNFGFWFSGIETGIAWLSLDEIDIDFTTTSKTVLLLWDVVLGDLVCVTPYFSLTGGGHIIDGVELNALLLEYSYNGVTVKAGEIFDYTWGWQLNDGDHDTEWGFSTSGGLSYSCYYELGNVYDEFFGVWIDGDSCCGGAYDISVINFFNTTLAGTALFDWVETLASLEVGIGPNVSIGLSMSLKVDGLQWFQICGTFSF